MNSDLLIRKLNQLEHWLEETKGHYEMYPLRWLGYLLLIKIMIISNLLALIRWPVHSLIETFRPSGLDTDLNIHDDRPNEVDAALMDEIIQNRTTVLVDFWAAWCGPCIMMNKPLKRIALSTEVNCTIAKVDTVKHHQLAEEYNVKGLPTVILFKNGEEVKRYAGALSYAGLKEFIGA